VQRGLKEHADTSFTNVKEKKNASKILLKREKENRETSVVSVKKHKHREKVKPKNG